MTTGRINQVTIKSIPTSYRLNEQAFIKPFDLNINTAKSIAE
jgi:hypothetical protein